MLDTHSFSAVYNTTGADHRRAGRRGALQQARGYTHDFYDNFHCGFEFSSTRLSEGGAPLITLRNLRPPGFLK